MRMAKAVFIISFIFAPLTLSAQESFPLIGTWRGDWQTGPEDSVPFIMVMDWDGKSISGILNPGRNAVSINAMLHPDTWQVEIYATTKEGQQLAFSGTLKNIGNYDRNIEGMVTTDANRFPFNMIRE